MICVSKVLGKEKKNKLNENIVKIEWEASLAGELVICHFRAAVGEKLISTTLRRIYCELLMPETVPCQVWWIADTG